MAAQATELYHVHLGYGVLSGKYLRLVSCQMMSEQVLYINNSLIIHINVQLMIYWTLIF